MSVLALVITFFYSLLIISFIIGFDKIIPFILPKKFKPKTRFTIIIPFRNEEENLPELLNSLALLNYPRDQFEILLINDASEDTSVKLIKRFKERHPRLVLKQIENQRKSGSPKKDAINLAISHASHDWIVTTDADCVVPLKWLEAFDAYIQKNQPSFIAAPVSYNSYSHFIKQFQFFDLMSLQASTIAGFGLKRAFMCNGANLCYKKAIFIEVEGYLENDHIASGDDVFLLEKVFKKFPDSVHFLKSKDALVISKPQASFKELISQRIRWASKIGAIKNSFAQIVGLIVFGFNLLLVIVYFRGLLRFEIGLFFILFFLKLILDTILIQKVGKVFGLKMDLIELLRTPRLYWRKGKHPLKFYLLANIVYPFYTIYVVILSFNKPYFWKGRSYKSN